MAHNQHQSPYKGPKIDQFRLAVHGPKNHDFRANMLQMGSKSANSTENAKLGILTEIAVLPLF